MKEDDVLDEELDYGTGNTEEGPITEETDGEVSSGMDEDEEGIAAQLVEPETGDGGVGEMDKKIASRVLM